MSGADAVPAADLELLRQFDTPTVCNVIELLAIRPRTAGYMDGRIRACFPELPPMVGYATTATFRAAEAPASGEAYSGIEAQIEAMAGVPTPRVVVFQDLDDPPVAATFGEVMCTTYQRFGCVGIITSGAGRDLEQVRALKFAAFSSGTICSHGYCHLVSLNVPVRVGGLVVRPGDLLHGDANGVTSIPKEHASAVARACAEFVEAEAVVLDCLKSGQVDVASYRRARKELGQRVRRLGERLRSDAAGR